MPGSPIVTSTNERRKPTKYRRLSLSKPNSKAPSRSNSRAQFSVPNSRRNSVFENDEDGSIREALKNAEQGDFKGLTEVIVRGDGASIIPLKSKNEDVQDFLNQVPRHLVR